MIGKGISFFYVLIYIRDDIEIEKLRHLSKEIKGSDLMFKAVKNLCDRVLTDWNDESIVKIYPFIDDFYNLLEKFEEISKNTYEYSDSKLYSVISNTLNNVHRILTEVLNSVIIGQRISLSSLNRSLIENYIVFSFLVKHGEKAAELFIADSEIVFQKNVKIYNDNLKREDIAKVDAIILETKNEYLDVKFGDGYKWGNSFIERKMDDRTGLEDISKDTDLHKHYQRLKTFHTQTHNSSALSHYLNITQYDSVLIYLSRIMNAIFYGSVILKLVVKEESYDEYYKIYMELAYKYDKVIATI